MRCAYKVCTSISALHGVLLFERWQQKTAGGAGWRITPVFLQISCLNFCQGMLQEQLANQESQSCDPPAAVACWCFAWSFSYSMCSKMFNTAETLAKMGLKRYLDLPCIDANEKLNSGNYKSIPFWKQGQ